LAVGISSVGSLDRDLRLTAFERGHQEPHDFVDDPLAAAEPAVLRLAHLEPGARAAQPTRFRVRFTAVCPPGPALTWLDLVE